MPGEGRHAKTSEACVGRCDAVGGGAARSRCLAGSDDARANVWTCTVSAVINGPIAHGASPNIAPETTPRDVVCCCVRTRSYGGRVDLFAASEGATLLLLGFALELALADGLLLLI
jgi:hypothetical protein